MFTYLLFVRQEWMGWERSLARSRSHSFSENCQFQCGNTHTHNTFIETSNGFLSRSSNFLCLSFRFLIFILCSCVYGDGFFVFVFFSHSFSFVSCHTMIKPSNLACIWMLLKNENFNWKTHYQMNKNENNNKESW